MTRAAFVLFLLFAACRQVHVVDRATIGAEQFLLVALDGDGDIRVVSKLYETGGTEQALLDVEGELADVYIVGLARDQLRAADPRLDETRPLILTVAAPPASGELYLRGDHASMHLALPETAPILEARTGEAAANAARDQIRRALTLELPIIIDHCLEDHPMSLAPFGATADLLGGASHGDYRNIIRVLGHEDRAMVLTPGALYVVERGGSVDLSILSSTVSAFFETPVLPARSLGPTARFTTMTAYFQLIDGEKQLLLGGQSDGFAAIWRVALGRSGVRLIQPIEIRPPQALDLRDLMIDGQDLPVAVGDEGMVLTGEVLGREFRRVNTPRGATGEIRRAAASHILTQPHAIATQSPRLYLGYAFAGYWDEILLPARADGIAASFDGDDMLIVGERGAVVRRLSSSSEVNALSLVYPPSLSACAVADPRTGRLSFEDDLIGAATDETFFFFQPEHCTSLVRVRRSDLCVTAVEDQGRARISADRRMLVGSWADNILVGGPAGSLLEVVRH